MWFSVYLKLLLLKKKKPTPFHALPWTDVTLSHIGINSHFSLESLPRTRWCRLTQLIIIIIIISLLPANDHLIIAIKSLD